MKVRRFDVGRRELWQLLAVLSIYGMLFQHAHQLVDFRGPLSKPVCGRSVLALFGRKWWSWLIDSRKENNWVVLVIVSVGPETT